MPTLVFFQCSPLTPSIFLVIFVSPKVIFIGINPGFNEEGNRKEQGFLQNRGLLEGYCRLFADFFPNTKRGLIPYYANIAGFLRRYYCISETIDWNWFQEHLIALELIPYHSINASGLRINNLQKYREVYFEIIMKFLNRLNPAKPNFHKSVPCCR
jgi:hypothetical protein